MSYKVLGLHGSQQNAEVLRTRLGRIVPKVKKNASFLFIDAPHILPLKAGDEIRYSAANFSICFSRSAFCARIAFRNHVHAIRNHVSTSVITNG